MSLTRLIGIATCIAALTSPAASQTRDVAKWGQVGGWEIRVDRSLGDGCFAFQVFERGTVVRIGFDVAKQQIYLFFGHDNWRSLEQGKTYVVRVVFDGVSTYDGEMQGELIGGSGPVFLAHLDLSADFVKDFMQRNNMEVFYRGDRIAHLSLRNTYAAVTEVVNCRRELGFASKRGGGSRESGDPFAKQPSSRGRDPFR